MFEKASRLKLRFETHKGILNSEDLWDLKKEDLNVIAKSLNKKRKEADEEDFLKKPTKENEIVSLQFEIVKHVLDTKVAEEEARKNAAANKEKREKLAAALARKQDSALEEMSEEELKAQLALLS